MGKDKASNEEKTDGLKLPSLETPNKRNRQLDRKLRKSFVGDVSRRPSTPDTAELSWSSNDPESLFPSLSYKRQTQQICHRKQPPDGRLPKLGEKEVESTKLPPVMTQKTSMTQNYKLAIAPQDKSILPPPPPSCTAPSKK